MIRPILILAGFALVTALLLLLQPAARPVQELAIPAPTPTPAQPAQVLNITGRAAPRHDAGAPPVPPDAGNGLNRAVTRALDRSTRPGPTDPTGPAPARVRPQLTDPATPDPTGPTSRDTLHAMSRDALRDIDTALGRHAMPGMPGSLLHAIVARSLADTHGPAQTGANRARDRYLALIRAEAKRTD